MLDEGSSITMVDKGIVDELGVGGKQCELNVQWFGGRTTQEMASLVELKISGKGMSKRHKLRHIYAVSNLNLPTQSLRACDVAKIKEIFHIEPQSYNNATPKILIGLDNCHLGLPFGTIELSHSGPFAANTKLGWVVFGQTSQSNLPRAKCMHVSQVHDDNLHEMMQRYFDIENFGVIAAPPVKGEEDTRAEHILKTTVTRVGGRYQAGLLWKSDCVQLPDSYVMAKIRLCGIERRMKKDANFADAYKGVMQKYIDSDYVRKLTPAEINLPHPRVWYLPHFAVVNLNKPGKLRLVFDAAAAVEGVSLNSYLLKGPQDYQLMANVLLSFRMGAVAVCGDIKEMFHQVLVQPGDRHAQRFLWRIDDRYEPDVYETFGAACSPCIAEYVKTLNALQHKETFPRAVEAIIKHHYVDDFVDSFQSVEEAIRVAKQVRDIHRAGGFQMRGFISNSSDVANSLREKGDSAEENIHFGVSNIVATKVLGMFWQPQDDAFRYELRLPRVKKDVIEGSRSPTKRELLSYVISIFDPLGFLCLLTVGANLLLREVWRRKIEWDTSIPADMNTWWEIWKANVNKATQVQVGRHYFPEYDSKQLQLHVFVDASEEAYAAVCYWRFTTSEGIRTALICAKTKCAPLKTTSIPRLELQAAVLGTRMAQMVIQEHKVLVHSSIFWSDSSTVISCIKSSQRGYKPFVAHRVAEILATTEPQDWRWISTLDNVADDATRRAQDIDLATTSRWFTGPAFLKQAERFWPQHVGDRTDPVAMSEAVEAASLLVVTNSDLIDFSRFSSYMRLKRTTAWVLRFIKRVRHQSDPKEQFGLTSSELNSAEKLLCRQAQAAFYSSEIRHLKEKQMAPTDSTIRSLSPILDSDGVMRVGGRIEAASCLSFEAVHQIILPAKHAITTLVIRDYHQRMKHQNIEATIGEIRQNFWIIQLRRELRKVIASCQVCKLERAKPFTPIMGQLPVDRLTPFVRPFSYTGLDYFGPLTVTIGRRTEKRWIALFTCLTIRAVHLEVAHELTDSCILAIRNFINRRGVSVRIRSDNVKNFVGVDQIARRFDEVFDCEKVQSELSSRGVE
ncbi:uncharacterized protein [Eurosta solidaginis]|uniref:uncharacterized protein n=1 Tax=Eurosta solidaginis TaxID=178769 RepID=UPI003530D036